MKLPYDHLIDTREKRAHACMLLFLIITILFFIPYVLLGILLITRDSYTSLFSMLSYPILSSSYLSRIILDVISMTSYTYIDIAKLLWTNIGPMEVLEAFMMVAAYTMYIHKKQTSIILLLQLSEVVACSMLVVIALKSGSLMEAIGYLRMIGLLFTIVNVISISICLWDTMLESMAYKESLAYQIEEIKEHMED